MAHYKRGKSRRQVRCTMCTPVRWLGNNTGRSRRILSRHRDRQKVRNQMHQEATE